MNQELTTRVKTLVAEALQVAPDQVTDELSFGDLPQWDSMGHMEVMLQLEAQFNVEIGADTIRDLTSIALICAYVGKE